MKEISIQEYVKDLSRVISNQEIITFEETSEDSDALNKIVEHFKAIQEATPNLIQEKSPLHILKKRKKEHFSPWKDGDYKLFVDCETDGLYGQFLSVGLICANKSGIESVYYIYRDDVKSSEIEFVNNIVLKRIEATDEQIAKKIGIESDKVKVQKVSSEIELVVCATKIFGQYEGSNVYADHLFPVEWRFFELMCEDFRGKFTLVELARISQLSVTTDNSDNDDSKDNHTAWYDAYQGYLKYKPISSHVFILPFIIEGKNKNQFKVGKNWEKQDKDIKNLPYFSVNNYPLVADDFDKSTECLTYSFSRFFNSEAMEIMQSHADTYILKHDSIKFYEIKMYSSETAYTLHINYVMMRLIKDNFGFLVLSMDNYLYDSLKDARNIDQYGRRVYDPFKLDNPSQMESAEDLLLLPLQSDLSSNEECNSNIKSAIKVLFELFFGFTIPIFTQIDKKRLTIRRILDDRMFVMSNYTFPEVDNELKEYAERDTEDSSLALRLSNNLLLKEKSQEVQLHTQQKLALASKANDELYGTEKTIYSWIYIDKDDSSCQSRKMIKDLLNTSLYDRWIDYGTLYGITQHSMIMMTGTGVPNYLLCYFYTEYLEMILIVLAQRVGILHFSDRAGEQAEGASSSELLQLQRDYVKFKNQFILPELSSQEQPIELYDLMQQNLYVNKQKEILDEQIESLYEVSQTEQNSHLNKFVLILSIMTLITAFNDFYDIFDKEWPQIKFIKIFSNKGLYRVSVYLILTILIILIVSLCPKVYRYLKEKLRK